MGMDESRRVWIAGERRNLIKCDVRHRMSIA